MLVLLVFDGLVGDGLFVNEVNMICMYVLLSYMYIVFIFEMFYLGLDCVKFVKFFFFDFCDNIFFGDFRFF